jgi:hypothetical protein
MKNAFIALIMICLTCASAECQVPPKNRPRPVGASLLPPTRPPRDYPLEPQWYNYSCWAASLSLTSKYVAPDLIQMNQCYFVDQLSQETDPIAYCGCDTHMDEIVSLSGEPCSTLHTTSGPDDLDSRFGLAQSINTNAKLLTRAIDLTFLRSTLKKGNPVIHAYEIQDSSEGAGKHVYPISGIENPRWKIFGKSFSTNLLLVKDPWPPQEGSEYYMTFEQYHLHRGHENIYFDKKRPGPFPQFETVAYMKRIFNTSNAPSALTAAKRFIAKLKEMNSNSVSVHFLEKTGIQGNLGKISVYPIGIDVEEINSYGTAEAPVNDSITLQSFSNTDIMFFLTHNGIAKSIVTVSKINSIDGDTNGFIDKWFISRLEKIGRYQSAYDLLLVSEPNTLAILRYKGAVSGEILTKKLPIKGKYVKMKVLSKTFNTEPNK